MGHVCVSSQRTVVFIRRLESKKRYDLSFDDDGLDNIFITPYAYKPIYSSEMTVSPLPDDFDVIVQTAIAIGIIGRRAWERDIEKETETDNSLLVGCSNARSGECLPVSVDMTDDVTCRRR